VHDSVWIDCKRDVAKEVAHAVATKMSAMCGTIEKAFPGVQIPVDMHVSVSGGENMARMRPLLRTKSNITASSAGMGVGQIVTEEVPGAFDELLASTYTPEHPQALVHPGTYTTGKMSATVAAALTQVAGAVVDLPSGAIKKVETKTVAPKKVKGGKKEAKAAKPKKVKGPEGSKLRKDLKLMKARSAHSSISKELRELEGLSPPGR
jgi:hypothetical protein